MNLNVPGPAQVPSWGNGYDSTLPLTGLSSLLQGLTQGVMMGGEMNMKRQALDNEAANRLAERQSREAWHRESLESLNAARGNTANHQKAMERIFGGDSDMAATFQKGLEDGTLSPEQLTLLGNGMAGAAAKQKALGGAMKNGFDPREADLKFKEDKYEKAAAAQQRVRTVKAVAPLVTDLRNTVTNSDISEIPLINTADAFFSKQSGKTKYTDLESKAKLIADEIQSMVGVGSDAKLKLIQGIADPSHLGKKQLLNGLDNIDEFMKKRAEAFGDEKSEGPAGAIHTYPSGKKVQWNGSAWVPYNG